MYSRLLIAIAVTFAAVHSVISQQSVLSTAGSCPTLSNNSAIFGSRTSFSNTGLVSTLFVTGDGTQPLTLRILRVHQLCEVSGLKRNTASSVAFIVEFENQDSSTETIVLAVDCLLDPNNPNAEFSFFPAPPDPVSQTSELNTARSSLTNTLIRPPSPSTFSTPINRTCGVCGNQGGIFANQETRCVFCNPLCNEGMRRCLGTGSDQCCNWYLNDVCQVTCPPPLVGNNETFDCGCVPLSVTDGTVTFSNRQLIGSVANYTCDGINGYVLSEGSSAMRTCTQDNGWTGSDSTCELFDCKFTGLTDPLNGQFSLQQSGVTTFGATANFKCNEGFQLIGSSTRNCTLTGWSGSNPTCDPEVKCDLECNSGTCEFNTLTNEMMCVCPIGKTGSDCSEAATSEPSTGSACGTPCIIGIVLAIVGAIILAAVVAGVAFGIYSYLNHPDTKLAKFEHDKFNGVARDNPLYVDPEAVVGDGAEAA